MIIALKLPAAVFILLTNIKVPTIVGILTFMSKINVMLSWVEHDKKRYDLKVRIRPNSQTRAESLTIK